MKSVISVNDLSKNFGKNPAVSQVSFQVEKGEVVGFIGLNGAGKTTTIAMMLGFIRPSHGQVSLFGQAVTPGTAHQSHADVGYASGDMSLPGNMTGREYLDFVQSHYQTRHDKQRAELTARFKPQLGAKLSTLSRGNRQKIALMAAFIARPHLVILDEPTSGLDPMMQQAFLDLVVQEKSRGTTIFMSSHYLEEVAEVCDRVIVLKDGQLINDMPSGQNLAAKAKQVRLLTKRAATPPPGAQQVTTSTQAGGVLSQFVYSGNISKLLTWLSAQRGVEDVSISDHNLDDRFRRLYTEKKHD